MFAFDETTTTKGQEKRNEPVLLMQGAVRHAHIHLCPLQHSGAGVRFVRLQLSPSMPTRMLHAQDLEKLKCAIQQFHTQVNK